MAVSDSPNGGSTPPPPPQQEQANDYEFSKPISLAGPTDSDLHRNLELEKVDSSHNSFFNSIHSHYFSVYKAIKIHLFFIFTSVFG